MLDGLRNFARTWPGKILGIFMLIGLAGFGMSGVFTSINFNTIAKVGSEEITTREFQRNYSRVLNNYAQEQGSMPTSSEAVSLGLVSNVINQLAFSAALNGLGKKFSLGISDNRLANIVRQDPSFLDTLGNFNANNFRMVLQQNGWTENEYFALQKKVGIQQQISLGLFDGIKVANTASELVTRYGDDKRTVEYFIVSKDNILPPSDPTDEEISQYLSENQADFRNSAQRKVKIIVLTPQIIANGIELSEAEIKAEYERTKASYNRIETRDISLVNLTSEQSVKRFEIGLEQNENFEDLVAELGLNTTNLDLVAQAQIADARIADEAFSLEEGEFSIYDGFDGKVAIYVARIEEGGQIPFEQVSEQIAQNLKLKQARKIYIDYLDQIEELRAAFKPIEEIADQFKLDLIDITIMQNGDGLENVNSIPEEGRLNVANRIFNAKKDSLAPSIALGANLNIWFDLEEIIPEHDQTLSQVKDKIFQILVDKKTQSALEQHVNELVKSIKNGQEFAEVAITNQYSLMQQNDLSRLAAPIESTFSAEVIEAIFRGASGFVSFAKNANGDYIIFHVLETIKADEINEGARQFIDSSIEGSIFNEFVSGLLNDEGLKINQQTLTQILEPNNGNR